MANGKKKQKKSKVQVREADISRADLVGQTTTSEKGGGFTSKSVSRISADQVGKSKGKGDVRYYAGVGASPSEPVAERMSEFDAQGKMVSSPADSIRGKNVEDYLTPERTGLFKFFKKRRKPNLNM